MQLYKYELMKTIVQKSKTRCCFIENARPKTTKIAISAEKKKVVKKKILKKT